MRVFQRVNLTHKNLRSREDVVNKRKWCKSGITDGFHMFGIEQKKKNVFLKWG